jgi:hypothetical protein
VSIEGGPLQAIGISTEEAVDLYVQEKLKELETRLNQVADKANAATEALGRKQSFRGQDLYWAQVTQAITPRAYDVFGSGYALMCIEIGSMIYLRYPHIGDPMLGVPVTNGAEALTDIPVNCLIQIRMVDGQWAVVWQDCNDTGSGGAFSDQPH